MSTWNTAAPQRRTDWMGSGWLVPSWLISLLLHVSTLLLLAAWMRHWPAEPVGFGDEPSREVGIVLKSAGTDVVEMPSDSEAESNPVDPVPQEELVTTPVAAPTAAPLLTPQASPSATDVPLPSIGAGVTFPTNMPGDARDVVKSGNPVSANAAAAGAIPGAAFMGARDDGTRIVFVVDCSASMANYGAMRSAKAALMSSLQSLSDAQQFQIIFYNQKPRPMTLRGQTGGQLAFATEINKSFARQHISGIEPDFGTDHMPALRLALRMGPEVIFFLTDADEPQLTTGELQELQRLNQGRARIHTIEFGVDAALDVDHFLKKLARQNGGTYRYYDVKRMRGQLPANGTL